MRGWSGAVAALGLAAAGTVAAQVAPPITYEEASLLAGSCFNCHGPEGVAPAGGAIPTIAGMPAARMIELLGAFRADLVPGATIMGRIALGYDGAEIAALARYFAGGWTGGTP